MSIFNFLSRWNRKRLDRRKFARQCKETPSYEAWLRQHATLTKEKLEKLQSSLGQLGPRISVVIPTYNPRIEHLEAAVQSVLRQIHQNLEVCIADDASTDPEVQRCIVRLAAKDSRIRYVFRRQNGHISEASNSALALATGDYVALMDQDDLLPEYALAAVAAAVRRWPDAGLIYSDEDKVDETGRRFQPHFKPDWNLTLLRSQNYICHLAVFKRDLIEQLGGFRVGYEGSQDHDLLLRCAEQLRGDQIVHIPLILYHWRVHEGSTAQTLDTKPYALTSGCKAVQSHVDRLGLRAVVSNDGLFYRARYELPVPPPKVSILLLTRDRPELLKKCVSSVLAQTSYPNFEMVIIDNGTIDVEALAILAEFALDPRVRVIRDPSDFNYSKLNNEAARHASGEYFCLMNNDIEILHPDWLHEMVAVVSQSGVGVVGSRLYYPDGRLQHAGVIVGLGGVAAHPFRGQAKSDAHYMFRTMLMQELSAVTAACLITPRYVYEHVGGFDSDHLAVAFNDVDYCLRVRRAGFKVIYDPYAEFVHHESVSRGRENTLEKKRRFESEVRYMKQTWADWLRADPAYNPNLTSRHESFSLTNQPRVSIEEWLLQPGSTENESLQRLSLRVSRGLV